MGNEERRKQENERNREETTEKKKNKKKKNKKKKNKTKDKEREEKKKVIFTNRYSSKSVVDGPPFNFSVPPSNSSSSSPFSLFLLPPLENLWLNLFPKLCTPFVFRDTTSGLFWGSSDASWPPCGSVGFFSFPLQFPICGNKRKLKARERLKSTINEEEESFQKILSMMCAIKLKMLWLLGG